MPNYRKKIKDQKKKQIEKPNGLYIFKNITNGDLFLPRPTKQGIKVVPKHEKFEGDSYYLMMVPNELRILEDLNMEKTLITEQPPIVKEKGQIEYVLATDKSSINETDDKETNTPKEVLITECPSEGVEIIAD